VGRVSGAFSLARPSPQFQEGITRMEHPTLHGHHHNIVAGLRSVLQLRGVVIYFTQVASFSPYRLWSDPLLPRHI
jgi:hypothetical protein